MKNRLVIPCLSASIWLLSSCAYVNPYIPLYDSGLKPITASPSQAITSQLPKTAEAVGLLDHYAARAESKRNQVGTYRRSFDLASFGLATGAAVSPIYKAHRDLTTGLGLGAAAIFSGSALFLSSDREDLYNSALSSLICLKSRGVGLSMAMSTARDDNGRDLLLSLYDTTTSSADWVCAKPEAQAEITAAYEAASLSARRLLGSDAIAGGKLTQAAVAVVSTLNGEIKKRDPSSLAILAAAKSLASGVGAPAPESTDSKKTVTAAKAPGDKRLPECDKPPNAAAAERMKSEVTALFQAKKKGLDAALDTLESLETACVFAVAAVADLAVSPETVVLVKDAHVNVRITGGRPPYTWMWDSDPQANGITLTQVAPDTLALRGTAAITSDKTYKLEIRDSSAATRSKQVGVSAKKSPSS